MTIDFISLMFGICIGVVPTVIVMTAAAFWDDWRGGKDDD